VFVQTDPKVFICDLSSADIHINVYFLSMPYTYNKTSHLYGLTTSAMHARLEFWTLAEDA